ncbi:hypothetical protein J4402_02590 [Candidatus Pacearchaeota archaeon]|nr:hypothetical protein [Candidatus Pacearchaeota archaeon]
MNFKDFFRPYSPEIRGNLEEYLRQHDGTSADNLFHGPEYFFIIRDRRLMVPDLTCVRVDQSPIPDILYFVNSDYLLESSGSGEDNMSLMWAKKGTYNPEHALRNKNWSILHLNI